MEKNQSETFVKHFQKSLWRKGKKPQVGFFSPRRSEKISRQNVSGYVTRLRFTPRKPVRVLKREAFASKHMKRSSLVVFVYPSLAAVLHREASIIFSAGSRSTYTRGRCGLSSTSREQEGVWAGLGERLDRSQRMKHKLYYPPANSFSFTFVRIKRKSRNSAFFEATIFVNKLSSLWFKNLLSVIINTVFAYLTLSYVESQL